jgi:hypothetical protein
MRKACSYARRTPQNAVGHSKMFIIVGPSQVAVTISRPEMANKMADIISHSKLANSVRGIRMHT